MFHVEVNLIYICYLVNLVVVFCGPLETNRMSYVALGEKSFPNPN